MVNKGFFGNESPVMKSIEAVKAMCSALGKPQEEPPKAVKLSRDVYLVLSTNENCHYTIIRKHSPSAQRDSIIPTGYASMPGSTWASSQSGTQQTTWSAFS